MATKKGTPPSKDKGEAKVGMTPHGLTLLINELYTRTEYIRSIIDSGGKDLNTDCGYPNTILAKDYANFYAREGIAARVVDIWAKECWSKPPDVYETEDPEQKTEFERVWNEVNEEHHVLSVLARADRLSGIGRYGIILIGLDDGEDLSKPVDGVDDRGTGRIGGSGGVTRRLLYLRTFPETVVDIATTETDPTKPRFSMPNQYTINFSLGTSQTSTRVHWTRVVHLADNREMSDVEGVPRLQKSYNRILDVRKILGGSGEMFWRGGFPGLSFERLPGYEDAEMDEDAVKEEMQNYMLGLQRWLSIVGMKANSLAPQVADPEHHLEAQLNAIAIGEGIPKRILFGSEQGELASSQDMRTWHRRVRERQEGYATPCVVRPFIDRLIAIGVLPTVGGYVVDWPDISTQTDQEKADVTAKWAEALAKYVGGSVDSVVPIEEFLSIFANMGPDEIQQITEALEQMIKEEEALTPEDEDVGMEQALQQAQAVK